MGNESDPPGVKMGSFPTECLSIQSERVEPAMNFQISNFISIEWEWIIEIHGHIRSILIKKERERKRKTERGNQSISANLLSKWQHRGPLNEFNFNQIKIESNSSEYSKTQWYISSYLKSISMLFTVVEFDSDYDSNDDSVLHLCGRTK